MSTLYTIPFLTTSGEEKTLADYKGDVILIVNTATECGLAGQFDGLEALWQEYGEQGLQVIGFPCDQFAGQEPVSDDDMANTCKLNHGVTFPLMAKIKVNGSDAHPLYRYLKKHKGGFLFSAIKWNFTKFLIDRDGQVVKRFGPQVAPEKMRKAIEGVL